jgi:hypothetical protein
MNYRVMLRYMPVLMSVGVVLSTGAVFILGGKPARIQVAAAISAMIGPSCYLSAMRKGAQPAALQRILATIFFSIGAILIVLDLWLGVSGPEPVPGA